jgi:deoxycytidylate deaminase
VKRRPSPKKSILQSVGNKNIWQTAEKEALRSPLTRFRAGSCIFNPASGAVLSSGCSHESLIEQSDVSSIHAERHALQRIGKNCAGLHIAIVTIGPSGHWSWSACPCASCAALLLDRGITAIHYPLWRNGWQIITEEPSALLSRAKRSTGPWARNKRIPLPA